MVFSSVIFILVFLPAAVAGYYVVPKRFKNYFLLAMSLVFFAWGSPAHLPLLLVSILINFHAALFIERGKDNPGAKRRALALGVAANLALLFYYKYFMFVLSNINALLGLDISVPNIILPVGISFFTFQGMSYIIDAYRGRVPVNRRFTDIALYISLFPQLIAGPIVNYKDIALQLHERKHSAALFASGIDRFITGLAKKILIGDVLGAAYTRIFAAFARGTDAASVWLAVICFTFHIYFDFSAYSDMAVGLGKMFGFDIMENFNYPYISASVTEFWRRWHISLSTWFRDYLYIPLGGNRRGSVYINLFIVFCATGIWHGASWQFLLWGLWHGLFLIMEKALKKRRVTDKIPRIAGWAFTMFVAVIGWVMFAADGVENAMDIYRAMFGLSNPGYVEFTWRYYLDSRVLATLILAVIGCGPVISRVGERLKGKPVVVIAKRAALMGLLALCIINAVSGTYSPFIYFRF